MFRIPTPRIPRCLAGWHLCSDLRCPGLKCPWRLLVLAWVILLVWIWWKGPAWRFYETYWLKPLANRWLATAVWVLLALIWLTVSVVKRLQRVEKTAEAAASGRAGSAYCGRQHSAALSRPLVAAAAAPSGQSSLSVATAVVHGDRSGGQRQNNILREGFPADVIYTPDASRGADQPVFITPYVGRQAVILIPMVYWRIRMMATYYTVACESTGWAGCCKSARASRLMA